MTQFIRKTRSKKPYIARFIRKIETKNHTSEETRHPHNAATNTTNTPPGSRSLKTTAVRMVHAST
jgi:hypothetical protein